MNEDYKSGDSIILDSERCSQGTYDAGEVSAALAEVCPVADSPWEHRFDHLLYDKMRFVTHALPTYDERIRLHRAYAFMREEFANIIQKHGLESLHGTVMSVGYGRGEDAPSALYSQSAKEYCRGLLDKDLFEGPVFSVFFRAVRKESKLKDASFAMISKLPEPVSSLLERMVA
jgi:hypothetical protein